LPADDGPGAVWAIIVAAGSGERFGSPKQLAPLQGRSVLSWSVTAACDLCDGVIVVVAPGQETAAAVSALPPTVRVVTGGPSRSESVRRGLRAVPPEAQVVVVHDAARPLADAGLWRAAVGAVRDGGADAAVCGVPLHDTIKRTRDGVVVETIDRTGVVAIQTPQAFRAAVLRAAHAGGADATDDAGLVEAAGGTVVVVPGAAANIKLTRREDLAMAERLLGVREQ
jgi:2-C-methyl-D-erythritol 4-phosphate cytidylyltransferase